MNKELGLSISTLSFAVSVTSLVSGLFIVVFGGLADRLGRVGLIRWGFYAAILGALCIALTPAQSALTAPILIAGRALQGLSGACIMPASLALLGVYWSGKGRQRAVSLWSMGTWGGSSFAALFGGFMISTLGWRAIFYVCALFAIIGLLLIKGLPESRAEQQQAKRFDIFGFVTFFVGILSLQLFIANAPVWGWLSLYSLSSIAISVIAIVIFIKVEQGQAGAFMNFALFRNKTFTGATISNLILNATAGVLVVSLSVLQQGGRIDPATAGYLTIGYGGSLFLFIRVGHLVAPPALWPSQADDLGLYADHRLSHPHVSDAAHDGRLYDPDGCGVRPLWYWASLLCDTLYRRGALELAARPLGTRLRHLQDGFVPWRSLRTGHITGYLQWHPSVGRADRTARQSDQLRGAAGQPQLPSRSDGDHVLQHRPAPPRYPLHRLDNT